MKKKLTSIPQFMVILVSGLLIYSCSGINKATDLFVKPTAKEIYLRDLKSPQLAELWEGQADLALQDSVTIRPPYSEAGRFHPKAFPVYSYEIALNPGEKLSVLLKTDSTETLVFIDLFKRKSDSLASYEHLLSSDHKSKALEAEITDPGIYKVVVQPEIASDTPFLLNIETLPIYNFPVATKGNEAIQSFWGASREGGRRNHEGIDIFAPRGTPVIATTPGKISRTGNSGLGGKQVWLRDRERGLSLYYAHLDSIIATPGMKVSAGDTLGLVGNTGNARTTSPHLHFGIYRSFSGAVNPLPYIYQPETLKASEKLPEEFSGKSYISTGTANLRKGPSTQFAALAKIPARDTLRILGKSDSWYHIRIRDKAAFIHESKVEALY